MAANRVLEAYFDAFNAHAPEAVVALFVDGGKYVDSAVSAGIAGNDLLDYLRGHYAAFPDARYRILRAVTGSDNLAACEWRFTGTNAGPLGNSAATHRGVDVLGASILEVSGDRISWLHGYYDRRNLLKQLGM